MQGLSKGLAIFNHDSPAVRGYRPIWYTVFFHQLRRKSHYHHGLHIHALQEGQAERQALYHLIALEHRWVDLDTTDEMLFKFLGVCLVSF